MSRYRPNSDTPLPITSDEGTPRQLLARLNSILIEFGAVSPKEHSALFLTSDDSLQDHYNNQQSRLKLEGMTRDEPLADPKTEQEAKEIRAALNQMFAAPA